MFDATLSKMFNRDRSEAFRKRLNVAKSKNG